MGYPEKGYSGNHQTPLQIRTTICCIVLCTFVTILHGNNYCFNPQNAFEHLHAQCEMGRGVPGTNAHYRCLKYIKDHLSSYSLTVEVQEFAGTPSLIGKTVVFKNIIGRYAPENEQKRILSAHWDTRPVAEKDPEAAARVYPISGANDGASGVAVLLEVARVISLRKPALGIDFIFFDGEDLGTSGRGREWCLGSRYYASHLSESERKAIIFGINIDMIGDRELLIKIERESFSSAPHLVDKLWKTGEQLYPEHFSRMFYPAAILDDHSPFLERGIEYIDVIDYGYPFWHTQEDTIDKCSSRSLEIVGTTLLMFLEKYETQKK